MSLEQLTTTLDLFVFGPNEMNGNESVEFMPDAPKYRLSETYSTVSNPKIRKNGWKVLLLKTSTFVE